jgi:hypothetical protein
LPHEPQFSTSLVVLTQARLHAMSPPAHSLVQPPAWQTWVASHAVVQSPQ